MPSSGKGSSYQATLEGGKAGSGLKQVRYGSLFRSVKVLRNIERTHAKFGIKGNTEWLSKSGKPDIKGKGKEKAEHAPKDVSDRSDTTSSTSSKSAGGSSSFVKQFRPLGRPLKTTVTPNADGKESVMGFGLSQFAPSPKRPTDFKIDLDERPGRESNQKRFKNLQDTFKRKSNHTHEEDRSRPSKSARLDADSAKGGSSTTAQAPPVPLFSTKANHEVRALTSKVGLAKSSNPITHSDMYTRTQHYVSASTGHQQSNRAGGQVEGEGNWMKLRAKKLQDQAEAKQSDLFKSVVVYINGYTGASITNQELIRLLQVHGAKVLYNPCAAVTHTISTMALSGKKTQESLQRKKVSAGSKLVSPSWVLDSIKEGKRMPERHYTVSTDETQGNLFSMWSKASQSSSTSR